VRGGLGSPSTLRKVRQQARRFGAALSSSLPPSLAASTAAALAPLHIEARARRGLVLDHAMAANDGPAQPMIGTDCDREFFDLLQ
jgi:hypothetical protein